MPSIKDLKKRIASTKNTQQTTRAMKMVSAAKLRRAQDAITAQRPYARRLDELIKRVIALSESPASSPLFGREKTDESGSVAKKNLLLVLVSSDRGLAGAFNGNVIKTAQRWVAANGADYASVKLAFVGRKAFDFFKTKRFNIGQNFTEVSGKVTFEKAKILADSLVQSYLDEEVDEVKFIYNEFKNAVSQVVRVESFLPLEPQAAEALKSGAAATQPEELPMYIMKPDSKLLLEELLKKQFSTQAFRILLESQASEHGSRMSAMENATKNAGEMIRKLTLQYNKQRQAGITKELLEIIAGSESQKG